MNLSGSPLDFLAAFLGGVAISFTPCVYPLIPITVGYIGIGAGGAKLKGLGLSFIYVTGVAVTYSILGLIASFTGTIFGEISAHPITHLFVGLVIVFFGLSMLELFSFSLPSLIKLPILKKENYFSTFLLGLCSGLIISPCLTPVLGSILVYLAAKKNLLYGAALLLSFAYGMGLILIIAGTFSAILANFPKSGKWMAYLKRVYAFILLAIGAYFIYTAIRRM